MVHPLHPSFWRNPARGGVGPVLAALLLLLARGAAAVESNPEAPDPGLPLLPIEAATKAWEPPPLTRKAPEPSSRRLLAFGRRLPSLVLPLGAWVLLDDRGLSRSLDTDYGHPGGGERTAHRVSRLGDPGFYLLPAVAIYLSGGERRSLLLDAVTAMADTGALVNAGKYLFGKERPVAAGGAIRFHGPGTAYDSFPSGHSAVAWSVATVVGDHCPRYKLLLYGLAAGVVWSRVEGDEHSIADVAFGSVMGVWSGRRVLRSGHGLLDFRF